MSSIAVSPMNIYLINLIPKVYVILSILFSISLVLSIIFLWQKFYFPDEDPFLLARRYTGFKFITWMTNPDVLIPIVFILLLLLILLPEKETLIEMVIADSISSSNNTQQNIDSVKDIIYAIKEASKEIIESGRISLGDLLKKLQ